MAYVVPTKTNFVERFPAFAETPDSAIETALGEAAGRVDESWMEQDFALARMLYAAHILTLDGHGKGAEAQAAASGMGSFQSVSSGSLSFSRAPQASSLLSTSYGERFYQLLKRNHVGPRVLTG